MVLRPVFWGPGSQQKPEAFSQSSLVDIIQIHLFFLLLLPCLGLKIPTGAIQTNGCFAGEESWYFRLHSSALVYTKPTHPKEPEDLHLGTRVLPAGQWCLPCLPLSCSRDLIGKKKISLCLVCGSEHGLEGHWNFVVWTFSNWCKYLGRAHKGQKTAESKRETDSLWGVPFWHSLPGLHNSAF